MANKRITDVDFIDSLNSNESFFVNQNSSIKQISKADVVFGINNGGTGATDAATALKNFGLSASSTELNHIKGVTSNVQTQINQLTSDINQLTSDIEEVQSKEFLPISGGVLTGATTFNGIILTEGVDYGTEEQRPPAGIKGRIYFQKVNI